MVGSFELATYLNYEWEAWLVSRFCVLKDGRRPHTIFSTEILVVRLLANGVLL